MKFSIFLVATLVCAQEAQAAALRQFAQTDSEMLGALAGAAGGAPPGGGDGGGTAQNTPSINIIDNARIMMLPGSVPQMGQMPAMMSQTAAEDGDDDGDDDDERQAGGAPGFHLSA